ncbi:hypothetical protein ACIQ6Y_08050 [Streptomyces sp. NPDC096205]|uniref:hypothetical protein n=1 Tax=Streptomyces sp. NPDC096205 TaxID=3366081 RepID=UPI0037F86770
MAKNKNRDRKRPQSERAPQSAQASPMHSESEQMAPPVSPADMARKGRQKRFGHN